MVLQKGTILHWNHAKGNLLVFLNQDTVVHNQWLSALVKGVTNGTYDVCHSNMLFPRNEEFKGIYEKKYPKNLYYYELTKFGYVNQIKRDLTEDIIETKALAGGSFIIKRNVLDKLSYLFDETFGMYNEDTDLALRLSKKGFKIGVVPTSVVYHFTNFKFKFNKYNLWKNLIMIRNRIAAYCKALNTKKFICFLPYLIFSQSHKVHTRSRELNNSYIKSSILACTVLPLSIISLMWFITSFTKISRKY